MKSIKHLLIISIITAILSPGICQGQTIKFARYPHICNGKIAFTYQDDIWIANDDGSNPRRLTNHVAKDIYPRFSPDGQTIAFCSSRMGNYDIFTVPIQGGAPTQLTWMTANDIMVNWTPDGESIIFRTMRTGMWRDQLYTVSRNGDLPSPLNIDAGYTGAISSDGRYLAFNRQSIPYGRKHYKGNANADIWLQDLQTQEITQLTDTHIKKFREHVHDRFPMWGRDGKIYFASERDDIFNIWSMPPKKAKARQVTHHTKGGVQYPTISPDGSTIIYENAFDLWKLTIPDGTPEKITIRFDYEPKENMLEYLRVSSEADEAAVSTDGKYAAVGYRGEIFLVPTDKERGEKTQVTDNESRDRYFAFSPDGEHLSYISDQSGDEEIWLYHIADRTARRLTTHESIKNEYLWSKDSEKIVWTAANKLFISDIETGETTELGYNDAYGFGLTDISKDGEWVVYHRQRDDINQDVYLLNVTTREEFNVTDNPFYDYNGIFSEDEQNLVFTSTRNNGARHLFVVPFEKVTEDRNDPLRKDKKDKNKEDDKKEKKQEDAPAKEQDKQNPPAADPNEPAPPAEVKEEKPEEPAFKLDLENIERRARQLTQSASDIGSAFVAKGKIYFTARQSNKSGLFSIGLNDKKEQKVTDGSFSGLKVSADKKMIVYRSGKSVYKMPLSSKKKEKIDFSFLIEIEKQKEWAQIFEECWRVMKYYFYDENMHGYDWDAIKAEYKPLLDSLSSYQDVYDLANLMIGELNASHTGVRGPTPPKPVSYQTQLPGFDMVPDGEYYKISHITWNGPADKEWIDLNVGDYVRSIDGKPVKAPDNYWRILNHCLNDYVTVEVSATPDDEDVRKVRIKTTTSLRDIKYEEWVEKNRLYVKEKTDDKIAYVHIRGMNRQCLSRFENEINRYHNHKGIIIDIRYNGGGNIDQQILDILSRRAYEYWNNRWAAPEMGRRHRQAIIGPKVMLINSRSASNSEVTPLGFQDLELGTVIGTPTAGAVIATRSYSLINGASIRQPGGLVVTYDPTQPNNYGINLENYGVAPDIWVENTPQDELEGNDRELDTAIKEAMKMLKKQQAHAPKSSQTATM